MQYRVSKFLRLAVILGGMSTSSSLKAQLTVSTALTPQQLVQNVLLGPGIIASNITYTGYARAIGKFTSVNTGLGLDSGIVMTSGSVLPNDSTFLNAGPAGPNLSGSDGANNGRPGDVDLDAVSATLTYDAAVLEFDFVAQSDSVKFRYVFGSEEYNDYVNSINDVFAFFLSGVTVTLTPTNIALIPSTTTPVTINNVNNGYSPTGVFATGPCMNCAYFVDNPTNSATYNLQYDGFTGVLAAKYPVLCGETYHIKIAIADAVDQVFDSGVFLEAGSFTTGQVNVSTQISYGSNNDSTLYEGCGQACIILERQGSTAVEDTVTLVIGGTAVNGVDFSPLIPTQIIFPVGQDSVVICIQAIQDLIAEGLETLTITSTVSGPCVQSVNSLTIYMSDFLPIIVDLGPDTSLCFASPINLDPTVTGGVEPYNYVWSTGATTPTISVSPSVTTSYIVNVTDPCGSPAGTDTVTVFLPNSAPFTTTPTPDLTLCSGDMAFTSVVATGGSLPYTYVWSTLSGPDTLPNPTASSNSYLPSANGSFIVMTSEGCGAFSLDTININVHDCDVIPPNVFTPNGDGTNDNLVFFGLDNFPGSALLVYNRWGVKIYENPDYRNEWNGSGVVDGTYYYILTKTDGTSISGFVTILK